MSRTDKISVTILLTIAFSLLVALPIAHAQGIPTQIVPKGCTGVNCNCDHLVELAQNILGTGIYIAVILSAVLFAWAGFKYLTTAYSAEQKNQAKEVLKNVVIGLVIILASWLIVDTLIKELLGKATDSGVWGAICGR